MLRLFVERPILSSVIAALILLAGLASIPTLPIAEYPQITPPTVTVTSTYIGADAATVESAVTNPIEESINGVQGLRYISSTSSNAGVSTITATFDPSRDVDLAAVDVQNRVQNVQGELPAAVTQTGSQITKSSGGFLMAIAFTSKDKRETTLALSNYLDRNISNPLLRVDGVSNVIIFGARQYAMRIWLDPRKLEFYGLGASDVTTAVVYRTPLPILEPETDYERNGLTSNVVFPSATDRRSNGVIDVYYGAADRVIAAARVTLPSELLADTLR